ncbi:MAG: hypothetical protein HQK51_18235, partial [Oligoflexia bacterium]|nr:hypothetical protein [Oligoflexia bacterium]
MIKKVSIKKFFLLFNFYFIVYLFFASTLSITFYFTGIDFCCGIGFNFVKNANAQGIFQEKIRKIASKKRSVYITDGVFFKGVNSATSRISNNTSDTKELNVDVESGSESQNDFTETMDSKKITMNSIRHMYKAKEGFERIVFDFNAKKIPRMYAFVSNKEKKLYLDFYNTSIN